MGKKETASAVSSIVLLKPLILNFLRLVEAVPGVIVLVGLQEVVKGAFLPEHQRGLVLEVLELLESPYKRPKAARSVSVMLSFSHVKSSTSTSQVSL